MHTSSAPARKASHQHSYNALHGLIADRSPSCPFGRDVDETDDHRVSCPATNCFRARADELILSTLRRAGYDGPSFGWLETANCPISVRGAWPATDLGLSLAVSEIYYYQHLCARTCFTPCFQVWLSAALDRSRI
jgi:hypothetical protein